MAAGLPIEKWFVLFLLAGQSALFPVQPSTPVVPVQEEISSLKVFTPVMGLTESVTEQIRGELIQNRSA